MNWQQIKAIILLPFTAVVVIPAIILYFSGVGGMALHRAARPQVHQRGKPVRRVVPGMSRETPAAQGPEPGAMH